MDATRDGFQPDCRPVRVVRGVDVSNAARVAELFYVSFGEKLAGLVLPRDRDTGLDLLARSLCLGEVYAALDGSDRVLGVAFVTGHDRVLCLSRDALTAAFGPLGGAWRYAAYRTLTARRRAYPRDTRGLEGFSVDPACRGKGVGAAMVEQIAADARREGARAIELNVGDTNPARHLYERAGFRVTRTGGVWPFARRLGFKRFVYYELEL
jgi:ribosomal protein S18 acetylase RimI-like enzyme